jgi:serine/threonine protein kinase
MNYKEKYLKMKIKYDELKNKIAGGKCSFKELNDLFILISKKETSLDKKIFKKNGQEYYKFNHFLCGIGGFKKVWAGFDKKNKSLIAWNEIDESNDFNSELRLLNEIKLLKNLNHKNILKLKDYWKDDSKHILITDIINNGTINEYYDKNNLNYDIFKNHIIQILEGLNYLHKINIIHRDIKPENIGLNFNDIKIMDFGISTKYISDSLNSLNKRHKFFRQKSITDDVNFSILGTPQFMAPEMFQDNFKYNETIDIYAFGHTILSIIFNLSPFEELMSNIQDQIVLTVKISFFQNQIFNLYKEYENNSNKEYYLNKILELEYQKYININDNNLDDVDKVQKFIFNINPKLKEIIDISISNITNRLSALALINILNNLKDKKYYIESKIKDEKKNIMHSNAMDLLAHPNEDIKKEKIVYSSAMDLLAPPNEDIKKEKIVYSSAMDLLAPPNEDIKKEKIVYSSAMDLLASPEEKGPLKKKIRL